MSASGGGPLQIPDGRCLAVLYSVVGVVGAWWLCFVLSYLFQVRDQKGASVLQDIDCGSRADAAEKLMNTPFFVLIAVLAIRATLDLRESVDSRWADHSTASVWCMSLYTVRMAWDTIHQQVSLAHDVKKYRQMMLHHILSGMSVGAGLFTGKCAFYACFDIICEITTIFLNNIFALKLLCAPSKLQEALVAVNGVFLWAGFVVFRLVLFPVWLYSFFSDIARYPQKTWDTVHPVFTIMWAATTMLLLTLSSIWFVPITQGLLKALGGKKEVDNEEELESCSESLTEDGSAE